MTNINAVVVMVTVSERVESLNNFLQSLQRHEPGRDIFIHMQGEDRTAEVVVPEGVRATFLYTEERLGCHAARVVALRALKGKGYTHYINVDDDVQLLPDTNWEPALEKSSEPGVGFVLTNWVRSPALLARARERVREEFIPAVFVYQGGGMAYGEEVADLMRDLPVVHARYDDIWPLTAYLHGFRNYRYRGSLALHRILGTGGMSTYMSETPRPLLCWDWVNYRHLPKGRPGRDYSIPSDSDLKPEAREEHRKARRARGWA